MAKYSTKFKYEIVKRYLDGEGSYESLSKTFNIPDKHQIRVRVNAYQTLGYDGLKRSRNKKQYSTDFKLKVVKFYLTGEMSYLDPKKRGRPSSMTNKDKKTSKSIDKEYSTEQKDRIKELEEQVYWLQMEVDILKKKRELRQRSKLKKKK